MTLLNIVSAGWQEQQQDRKDAAIPGKHCFLQRIMKLCLVGKEEGREELSSKGEMVKPDAMEIVY